MEKGRRLSERDLEILKAFLINCVEIKSDQEPLITKTESESGHSEQQPLFSQTYDEMLNLIKKVFINAAPGLPLPILDVRKKLQQLIDALHEYKPLTFVLKSFQKEDDLYHNSILVALTSYHLAIWHNMPQKDWIQIALGGLLHDIGSLSVDQKLLQKTSPLSKQEKEEIQRHTILGYNIVKGVPGINEGVKMCVLQHHEREDGSGYPLGVSGEKIHTYAKIVAVADIFHTMTGYRIHKEKMSPYLVLEKLHDKSFGKLNPAIVQTFIHKMTQMSNGSIVKLSDQSIGEIVFSDRSHPTRPWVKVNGNIINLTTNRDLHIIEVIKS